MKNIKKATLILTIFLFFIVSVCSASAAVLINEFMPNGPTPEPDSEWIELYNNGTSAVWLNGWNITDGEGTYTLPAVSIPSSGFVVLANNQTLFNSIYTTSATVVGYGSASTGNFNLANTNDNLALYDPGSNLIDSVSFNSPGENISSGRNYDGGPNFVNFSSPTPGTHNNRKPVISTIPNQTFAEDNNLTINFATYITDPDSDSMTLNVSSISNVAANVNGMSVTFVPDANFNGIRTATVTAADALSSTTSNTFQLNITAVNDPPSVNLPTVSFAEGSSATIDLDNYVTDPEDSLASLNWSRIGGDSNIGVSINPTTHDATFNATQDYSGFTAVILRVQDPNNASTDATVNVNVTPAQDAPTITLSSPADNATLNTTSVTLQWTASDVDNDPLTYYVYHSNSTTPTLYNTTINTQQTINNLNNGEIYYWRVIVSDNSTNVTSPTRQYTVDINPAPQITSYIPTSPVILIKNNTRAFNVTVSDTDALTHLWQLNGSTVANTSSNYLFDSSAYAVGNYLLNYTATDTYPNSVSQVWNISVREINPPVFSGPIPYVSVDEDSTQTLNLTKYFSDPDDDPLTYTATSANDLTVTFSNGIATITPASGFFGSRGLKFTASDGINQTASNIVTVVVKKDNQQPQITSFNPVNYVTKTADNREVHFSVGAQDAEKDPLNFNWFVDNELKEQTSNSHYNLNEYPNQFISYGYFNGQIIVGSDSTPQEVSAANKIMNSLGNIGLEVNNVYLPHEIRENNLILIGTPCSNSKIAELLQVSDCNSYFDTNEALIKAVDYNNHLALIVTGNNVNDVYDAAEVLADFENQDFSGSSHNLNSGSVSVQQVGDSFTFTTGSADSYSVKVEVSDSSGAKAAQEWVLEVHDRPIAETFNGQTTDFSSMSESDLSSVNLVLEKTSYGKIEFDTPIDMRDVIDLDSFVHIGQNIVAVDSDNLPELNQPATITLYNININDPVVYYTNTFTTSSNDAAQYCSSCNIVSHTDNEVKFQVSHFSTYTVKEAVAADIVLPDSVQVGSDDAERGENVTGQFTISNPGTTEAVENIEIDSSASSKYNVGFSTGNTYSSSLTISLQPGESKTINVRAYVPEKESGGKHSIGQVAASSSNLSDTATLYLYPANNLEIVSVEINDDSVSDGDTADIEPDSTLSVEVKVKNTGSVDFDNVDIIATIYDLDDDDVEEEVSFSLDEGDKQTETLTFEIPEELEEDEYDLEIIVEAEDDNDVTYSETLDITLKTEKEDHKLKLEADLSTEQVSCVRNINLYLTVKNLGEKDEDDVEIVVKNNALGVDISRRGIDIDENDKYRTTYSLDLNDASDGTYTIPVQVFRDDELADEAALTLEVSACQGTATETKEQGIDLKQISEKHAQLLQSHMAKTSAAVEEFRGSDIYTTLLAVMFIITLGVLIFVGGAVIIKMKKRQ